MKPITPFGLPIGISVTIWTLVGLIRFLSEKLIKPKKTKKKNRFQPEDIAVVIPAHNEEIIVRKCVKAVKVFLPANQIYVVSDGSTDKTYSNAKKEKCHVAKLKPGRGKARALKYLFKEYRLFERYKLILIVDADTKMDKDTLKFALPMFNDKDIKVVFASSQIKWPKHIMPRRKLYYVAYRDRLNRLLQYCFVYGQTWKYTNVNYVIPGFATMYRSDALKKLEIDTPGLLIEDFNLAFQFHKKKLGKIGYEPRMIGWDQYPESFVDYWKQVRRWNIGFFQTVKKNKIWPSMFWVALGIFSLEILLHSLFLLILPLVLLSTLSNFINIGPFSGMINTYESLPFYENYTIFDLFISIFFIDYIFTIIIGVWNRKPQYLIYGFFFIFMHYATSLILLSSIYPGFFGNSSGKWISPKRQA